MRSPRSADGRRISYGLREIALQRESRLRSGAARACDTAPAYSAGCRIKHLVFTHGHPDHIGSAAAIVRGTGARTYMHAADTSLAESGGPFRPMAPAPSFVHALMYKLAWKPDERMAPFRIDSTIEDEETLPILGGLQAIHVPGHCAGQVAFLWCGRKLLIGGDTFINILGVSDPIAFEDEAEGRRSQRKLAALDFDVAVFGHGAAITRDASSKLRRFVRRH